MFLFRSKKKQTEKLKALELFKQHFLDLEGSRDFPYDLALSSLNAVRKNVGSLDDFIACLLEDCIYTSVYATFFEQLFSTLAKNPTLSDKMIEKFSQDQDEREKIISNLSFNHVSYVENRGCPGCMSCENHKDVDDLIPYWESRDLDFFIKLYIGMQTIQFTFEQILYDLLPGNQQLVEAIEAADILELRKFLFNYSEQRLTSN
jgi:hypothetical protein